MTPRLLLVTATPALQHEAVSAAARFGAPIDVMPTLDAALSWLLRPDRLCSHVLAPADMKPRHLDALAGMVDEVTLLPTPLLLLGASDDHAPAFHDSATVVIEQTLRGEAAARPLQPPRLSATELRACLHAGHLRMRYQPILDAETLDPIGLEALARLHHPRYGILRPGDFMQPVIAAGLERILTAIVAARVMLDLGRLPGLLSLNVPLSTLCHADAVRRACELCAVAGVEPGQMIMEVLETQAPPDLRALGTAIERWRNAGFLVSIDDAGPRLAHWRALLDLPFTGLKLDGALANDADALSAEIVEAAKRAGLTVTAEGIEDEAALSRMRALGVDAVQGFLFCRPLPARALPIWVAEWGSGMLTRPNTARRAG